VSEPKIPPASFSRLWPAEDQERLGAGINNAARALQLGLTNMAADASAWWRTQQAQAAKQFPGVDPARLRVAPLHWYVEPEPAADTPTQQLYNAWVKKFPGRGPKHTDDQQWGKDNGVSRDNMRVLRKACPDPRLRRKGTKIIAKK
jgi:hypothetical protein